MNTLSTGMSMGSNCVINWVLCLNMIILPPDTGRETIQMTHGVRNLFPDAVQLESQYFKHSGF